MRLLELCQVAPLPNASSSTNNKTSHEFPLTFLDLPLLLHCSPEPLLFYSLPNIQINYFFNSILPQIKHSLSLTLQHFYPLAGTLTWSPKLNQPIIRYINGDSVTLTVGESNADFTHLCGYHARHAKDFQHLIPPLLTLDTPNSKDVPVLAVQVTLFPNSGICLGVTFLHAMMDGRAMAFFLKSWASTSRLGYSSLHEESLLPFIDRSIIKDVHGLQKLSLQRFSQFMQSKSMPEKDCMNWLMLAARVPITNQVTATLELKGVDIDMLRRWFLYKTDNIREQAPSRFELACAYVWVCLAKATNSSSARHDKASSAISSIVFVADYRSRLDPRVPKTYIGNCILSVKASARKSDIVGDNGIVVAVESIRRVIRDLSVGFVRNFEARISRSLLNCRYHGDVIEGSTQFDLYKVDFGWGKPKKFELASIVKARTIFFADSGNGDDDGEMEISLARGEDEMNAFSLNFVNGLVDLRKKKCCLCAL